MFKKLFRSPLQNGEPMQPNLADEIKRIDAELEAIRQQLATIKVRDPAKEYDEL